MRPTGGLVGWQGTSRAHEYATLRGTARTSVTKLRKSGRVLTSHRRSAEAARYFRWKIVAFYFGERADALIVLGLGGHGLVLRAGLVLGSVRRQSPDEPRYRYGQPYRR